MAQPRLSVRKIREVLRLHSENLSLSARAMSPTTVREYLDRAKAIGLSWPLPAGCSEEELHRRLFPEPHTPPSADRPPLDFPYIHQELTKPGVTRLLLWQEYRQCQPDGYSYSQFCELYRVWLAGEKIFMRIPRQAGEEMEVDYAGTTVKIVDPQTGEITKGYVFVAALPASEFFYVEVQPDCTLPHWIGGNVRALQFFGGVPRILIPDNLKTGVKRSNFYEPDLNPTFQYFAEWFQIAVLPARVRKPQDKPHAESAVQQVTRWVLAPLRNRTFFSVEEANRAAQAKAEEVLDKKMKHLGKSRRELFEEIERPALRPLPERPFVYVEIKLAKAHLDYHVEYDHHYYSVPHTLRGKPIEVRAGEHVIQLFFRQGLVVTHVRSRVRGGYTTLPEHMPPKHRFVRDVLRNHRGGTAWVLAQAQQVGPRTAEYVQLLMDDREYPEQGIRGGLGVIALARKHPRETMERACALLAKTDRPSCQALRTLLERWKRTPPPAEGCPAPLPEHANLRGQSSFFSKGE
jgi:transposase